jgi:hypothetical protein
MPFDEFAFLTSVLDYIARQMEAPSKIEVVKIFKVRFPVIPFFFPCMRCFFSFFSSAVDLGSLCAGPRTGEGFGRAGQALSALHELGIDVVRRNIHPSSGVNSHFICCTDIAVHSAPAQLSYVSSFGLVASIVSAFFPRAHQGGAGMREGTKSPTVLEALYFFYVT